VPSGQRDDSLRTCSWFSRPEPLRFVSISSSVVLTRPSGLRSRPTTSQKMWSPGDRTRDLWICSQELWPLDHRGFRLKSKLLYDWQSVCLGIEHPCGTCDQILFPVGMLLSEICGFVSMRRPLWREDGSAIRNLVTKFILKNSFCTSQENRVPMGLNFTFLFFIAFFTIYSRYLKRVISKRDGCEYLKQVPSSDGSLELI
jgi:hypothetical protein